MLQEGRHIASHAIAASCNSLANVQVIPCHEFIECTRTFSHVRKSRYHLSICSIPLGTLICGLTIAPLLAGYKIMPSRDGLGRDPTHGLTAAMSIRRHCKFLPICQPCGKSTWEPG